MIFTYLGTAAAEGIPGIYCNCETCQRALRLGGKNIMTRSQALIDGKLLIDHGPDTYLHCLKMKKTLWNIEHVLITHTHTDHLSLLEIYNRLEGLAHGITAPKMKFYLSKDALEIITAEIYARKALTFEKINRRFEFVVIDSFRSFIIDGYKITPLPARHAFPEQAFIYLIEKDGKTVFYGNDTGFFDDIIDNYLTENGIKIDLLSLDCTNCDKPIIDCQVHMSMNQGAEIAQRFLSKGLISNKTLKYYTHFSHNQGMIYDDLCVAAKKYGFSVAHDALSLEF